MGVKFITLDADEFNQVCHRVHKLLTERADKAWQKHQKKPSQKSSDSHVEASKDAFAFVHLLELVEHMTAEIHDLRMTVSVMSQDDDIVSVVKNKKKDYLN